MATTARAPMSWAIESIWLGAIGLLAGLAITFVTARFTNGRRGNRARATITEVRERREPTLRHADPPTTSAAAPPAALPRPAPPAGSEPGIDSSPTGTPLTTTVVAPAREPRHIKVEPVRIAYFRCVGAELANQTCPRDEPYEDRVWAVLGGLAYCAEDPGSGDGELRITYRPGTPPELEVNADTPSFRERIAGTCWAALAAPDAPTPSFVAGRTVVSFRFSVRRLRSGGADPG